MARLSLDVQLLALEVMSVDALKAEWRRVHKTQPPQMSRRLLVLALGYEAQCQALGKLLPNVRTLLHEGCRRSGKRSLSVPCGARLMRSWQGQTYVVETSENGTIRWNNREWRSLSEVARAITGTRWSGPAFFGLQTRKETGV